MIKAFVASLGISLCACASTPEATAPESDESVCVSVERLAVWEPLDERTLLLQAPGELRSHLLRLAEPIAGLMLAEELEVADGDLDGLICPGGVDTISATPPSGKPATITSIEYLTEQQTAELLGESIV